MGKKKSRDRLRDPGLYLTLSLDFFDTFLLLLFAYQSLIGFEQMLHEYRVNSQMRDSRNLLVEAR